jgi:hypothetical protein
LKLLLLAGILCILVVGGCSVLSYFGLRTLHEEAESALGRNAVIREHIGMIKDLDPNYTEFEPDKSLSYMIEGSKGFGKVRFKASPSNREFRIQSGTLEMSTGEVHELIPGHSPPREFPGVD